MVKKSKKKQQKDSGESCRNCGDPMPLIAVKYMFQCPKCGIRTTKTDEFVGKQRKESNE